MPSRYHQTRLRQIALLPVIFEDPSVAQWGLHNFLIPIGGDIIEVVAPYRPGTTAGRLLDRRGDGGYMIIMQTLKADDRRKETELHGGKVIFAHEFKYEYPEWNGVKDEGWCIQYHPKGIMGGMMPELDSHAVSEKNMDPLGERFSPWHACGKQYGNYVEGMKSAGKLHLRGCTLRLGKHNTVDDALEQWGGLFRLARAEHALKFTNCNMMFVQGQKGEKEGLLSITIGIEGSIRMNDIIERGKKEGVWKDAYLELVGVRWYVTALDGGKARI